MPVTSVGLGSIDLDDGFRASRPLGYASSHLVDIEHPADKLPANWCTPSTRKPG